MAELDRLIDGIIDREGGYVNHPADRGGPTKYGITKATLERYLGKEVQDRAVREMPREMAVAIYRSLYIVGPGFHKIEDARLRAQVVDAGVMHGTGWAARRLQEVAGVRVDGIIGPVTLKAVNFQAKIDGLSGRFAARRIRKIARIVRRNPSQLVFLVGWIDRAASFLER